MDTRLKSSTKWTPFPDELTAQIVTVMNESFADYDIGGKFVVEGAIYPEEIILRIGLNKPNQLRQDNLEASVDYIAGSDDKAIEKIHLLVDFLGQAWETFLEDEPDVTELTQVWKEERFEKQVVFTRYTSVNSDLEKQADELLAQFEKKLVHEVKDVEDGDVYMSAETSVEESELNSELEFQANLSHHAEHVCDDPSHMH